MARPLRRFLRSRGVRAVACGVALAALVASPVLGYRQGPLGDRVGACGGVGPSCRDVNCHQTYPIDLTQLPWRMEEETGPLPPAYVPGRRYPLKITIDERPAPFANVWGFELSPQVDCPFSRSGGDIVALDTNRTRRFAELGLVYLSHRCTCPADDAWCCGYVPETEPSLISWSFLWDAPSAGSGAVTFWMAFNAANWDHTPNGDRITLANVTIPEDTTCPPPISDLRVTTSSCDAGAPSLQLSWSATSSAFRVRTTTDVAGAPPDRALWDDAGTSACLPMPAAALQYYSVAEDCGDGSEGAH